MKHYWERHTDGEGRWVNREEGPPGAELAALRRGTGREPGAEPAMWPYYTTLNDSGSVTNRLRAEHLVLVLFAVHQQSQSRPMHRTGVGLGVAMRAVRRQDKFSEQAVDRRFGAAVTATSIAEFGLHLRSLVGLLRSVDVPQPLDYTALFRDLVGWQDPRQQGRIRRRWGGQYFVWTEPNDPTDLATGAPA